MSLYDYEESKRIAAGGWQFHALIMAAMRQADSDNLDELRRAFPHVHKELQERYNAPGGRLPSDDGGLDRLVEYAREPQRGP